MWVAELARARLREQVAELRSQVRLVQTGDDPEAVHQMRVATRRLRAALRVFADVLPPAASGVGCELKWLAGVLGAVRDLDVQLHSLGEAAERLRAPPEAARPVLCLFATRRAAAREALLAALASSRYAALVDALEALPTHAWPEAQAPNPSDLIRARRRRLRRAGEAVGPESPPEQLHRLRIRAKQLRYTLECFADVYGPAARKLVRRATRLQDVLGAAQDAAVLGEQLREASLSEPGLPAPSVFLLGQLSELYAERVRDARRRAPRASRRVTGKPWKRLRRQMQLATAPALETPTPCSTDANTA